jgi:hypothetical protein
MRLDAAGNFDPVNLNHVRRTSPHFRSCLSYRELHQNQYVQYMDQFLELHFGSIIFYRPTLLTLCLLLFQSRRWASPKKMTRLFLGSLDFLAKISTSQWLLQVCQF